jgi:hypothetical protein
MTETVQAWKRGKDGYFIEMAPAARKDYGLDLTDFLGAEQLATCEVTLDQNMTQAGNTEISGNAAKFILVAGATIGKWPCSIRFTGSDGLIDFVRFRVKVK